MHHRLSLSTVPPFTNISSCVASHLKRQLSPITTSTHQSTSSLHHSSLSSQTIPTHLISQILQNQHFIMSSRGTYSSPMNMSPAPPSDLPTYARFMHQHTKKQMEEASRSSHRSGHRAANSSTSVLPNGISPSSSGSSSRSPYVEYHN